MSCELRRGKNPAQPHSLQPQLGSGARQIPRSRLFRLEWWPPPPSFLGPCQSMPFQTTNREAGTPDALNLRRQTRTYWKPLKHGRPTECPPQIGAAISLALLSERKGLSPPFPSRIANLSTSSTLRVYDFFLFVVSFH